MAKVYIYTASLNVTAIDDSSYLIDEAYLTDVPDDLIERYELVRDLFQNVQNELEFYREPTSQQEDDEDESFS